MTSRAQSAGLAGLLLMALGHGADGAEKAQGTQRPADCDAVAARISDTVQATPRRDQSVEALGLTLTDELAVPGELYQRLERDIQAIKAENPDLVEIEHRHEYDPSSLLVEADTAATARAIRDGRYKAWRCMQQHYGQRAVYHMFGNHFDVRFEGVFDMNQLGERYTELPGIVHTNLNLNMGDGSTITVSREDETYRYRFIEKWGDCVSGCTASRAWEYEVGPDGGVELLSQPGPDDPAPPESR